MDKAGFDDYITRFNRLDDAGKFADILVAYNSFTGTTRDGSTVELGLPH